MPIYQKLENFLETEFGGSFFIRQDLPEGTPLNRLKLPIQILLCIGRESRAFFEFDSVLDKAKEFIATTDIRLKARHPNISVKCLILLHLKLNTFAKNDRIPNF
ncbi:MAG: hypothetical protein K0Q49_2370 [Haloplasmataceae bacterium]|jgi:hypothetical protein|nr:hypothetical protein [Haloplasmataceae bacterium]